MFCVYNHRRWLTARSSGKQQAVCTAVRAALMVCPEEGHFVRFQKRKLFCRSNGCSFLGFSPASVPEGFQRASGKSFGAPAGAYPCWGLTRRLRRGSRAYSPMGRSHFSFGGERKVCKRKPAARRLQRRPAPLRVAGFGLREPNGWMSRIYSGHPIPALRPEQSDHVPWADCPQGLSSTSARCAHPPGKSPLMPIFERGSSQCRAQHCWRDNSYIRARSCSLFSSFKKGKAFSLRCLSPLCSPAVGTGQT